MRKFLTMAVLVIMTVVFTSSCKKNFDNPPAYVDPNIVANTTIKTLKALHSSGGYEAITTDIIISGIVVADDRSGNFYKELYIQDASGAVALQLDGTSLYTQFPVGRKIFIKCKGLYLSDYSGMIQLGVIDNSIPNNPSLAGIPSNLFDTYIAKGSSNNPVVARAISQSLLTTGIQDTLLGTLIKLSGYEFASSDTSRTWADTSSAKNSINLTIKDCGGNSIIIRTSGYSNFAGQKPPRGNGEVTAIYTIFGTTKQLIIRDPVDVVFNGERCSLFEEDFSSITVNNATFAMTGWKNIAEAGTTLYQNGIFGTTGKVAKVSAFGSTAPVVTSWLITPGIPLPAGTSPKLTFTTSDAFDNGATLKAYISTNYNGSATPSTSTWTLLPATISSGHTTSTFGPFVSSGILNLSAWAGQTAFIGFRYDGSSTKTTTLEVDDVRVLRQ